MKKTMLMMLLLLLAVTVAACGSRHASPDDSSLTDEAGSASSETAGAGSETTPPIREEVPLDGTVYTVQVGDTYLRVDTATGLAVSAGSKALDMNFDRILVDVGYDSRYVWDTVPFQSYDAFSSTTLPTVQPNPDSFQRDYTVEGIYDVGGGLEISLRCGTLRVIYHYTVEEDYIALSAEIVSTAASARLINGVAFDIRGMELGEGFYEFPGNLPYGKFSLDEKRPYIVNSTLFCGSATSFSTEIGEFNVLFIDEEEKWSTGVYRDREDRSGIMNVAAVECYAEKEQPITVGTLYLCFPSGDRYENIPEMITRLGFVSGGSGFDCGPIWCGHPAGTTDTEYSLGKDLFEFSEELSGLADMGIGTVWLMPLFDHADKMYAPDSLESIYPGYGGEAGARAYLEEAHRLGMKVILDIVPHGPLPGSAFAKNHEDWISRTRGGREQLEWNCVSFDYNNKDYAEWVRRVMERYGQLGFDGSRIDCAMGGMTNWNNETGKRPSSSNLGGGVNITKAVAEGFEDADVQAVILPEMFYPIPHYIRSTDYYYNNAFYRVLMDLNAGWLGHDMTYYAQTVTEFLDVQYRTKLPGQIMVNWLENHDTVFWSGDCKRAASLYGERTKAMFCLISWIDGIPALYMGDENPGEYGLPGEDLRPFFKEIFEVREKYLRYDLQTEYLYTDSPLIAFYRYDDSERYLVLINLADAAIEYSAESAELLYADDGSRLSGQTVEIGGCGYTVLRMTD